MAHALFRALFLSVVRFFFRGWRVRGLQHVPGAGPCLVVANHPNGLLDPLVLRVALRRPLAFLGKSTLFSNPLGKLATGAFDAIPVYRPRDGEDAGRNQETFRRCSDLFARGGWLAMFPEGTSHSDPALKPMKTGAARMALSSEEAAGWTLGLVIVPAGLAYDDKETFRSRVAVAVGEPIRVADFRDAHARDPWSAVEALTARMGGALSAVTLEAPSPEHWAGFRAVAAWTLPSGAADLAAVDARARELAAAWRRLSASSPAEADALEQRARRFVRVLETVGIRDPWSVEPARAPGVGAVLAGLLPILLLWPLALVGLVLNAVPYKLIRPLSIHLSRGEVDVVSTIKAVAGVVLLPTAWAAWALLGLALSGPGLAAAMLVLVPLTGFVALRFDERLALRRELLAAFWLRTTRERVAQGVAQRRAELAEAVLAALGSHPR